MGAKKIKLDIALMMNCWKQGVSQKKKNSVSSSDVDQSSAATKTNVCRFCDELMKNVFLRHIRPNKLTVYRSHDELLKRSCQPKKKIIVSSSDVDQSSAATKISVCRFCDELMKNRFLRYRRPTKLSCISLS